VKLVIQEDGAGSFVCLEHLADGLPKGARRLGAVGHGEVEDGVGGGDVHPSADAEVSVCPCRIGGARGGEVMQQPKFPTRGLKRRRPLGVVGGFQLQGHGDVELDVDGGKGQRTGAESAASEMVLMAQGRGRRGQAAQSG
jgi:hypothetical protein